jgi:hypothetical protein
MTANVYVYHSAQPGIPQISVAGAAGELEAILYACGVTGFGGGVLDSLVQTNGTATATRSAGLNLNDGIVGLPQIVSISGSSNGWDGEYSFISTSGNPGNTSCTFSCPSNLPSPATGTITLKRAPAGLTRLASSASKSVWQVKDTPTFPGFIMLDDSQATYAGIRLAENAASPVDYSTMTALCPTVAQQANPGLYIGKTGGSGGSARQFVIVIWKGGVWIFTAYNNSYPGVYDPCYLGALVTRKAGDGFPGMIFGATADPHSSPPGNNNYFANKGATYNGQYLQRAYSQVGTAINFCKVASGFGNYIGAANQSSIDPNPVDNCNDIVGPIFISEGQAVAGSPIRGYFPGVWEAINCQNRSSLDLLTNMAALSGRTVMLLKYHNSGYMLGIDLTGPYA